MARKTLTTATNNAFSVRKSKHYIDTDNFLFESFVVLKISLMEICQFVSGHPVHSVRTQDIEGFLLFFSKT